MNLSIVSAKYVAPLKVELHFNDDTIKTIDVGAFIRNHPHPQYNSYLNENKFKKHCCPVKIVKYHLSSNSRNSFLDIQTLI